MSKMKVNRIENTSTASGGLDIDTSGKVRVTTLADSAGNNNSTPAEIASGRAKAWVNLNGTGTVAIRASYNVSSITDGGVGFYTVNFTTPMVDANYATAGFAAQESTTADNNVSFVGAKGTLASFYTASSCRIAVIRRDATVSDLSIVTLTFFR